MQLFITSVKARFDRQGHLELTEEERAKLRVVWRSFKGITHATRTRVKKCGQVSLRQAMSDYKIRAALMGYKPYQEPGFGRVPLAIIEAKEKPKASSVTQFLPDRLGRRRPVGAY